jgi:hypothetical protein
MLKKLLVASTMLIAVSVACGGPPQNPASPSAALPVAAGADSGDVTLKASAPTPTSPINNVKLDSLRPTLMIANATATHVTVTLQHRFQVMDASGAVVVDSGLISPSGGTTSYAVTIDLVANKPYTWRARAEYSGHYGPWSSVASFVTPDLSGYIRGAELYDPLTNGKTVGTVVGSVDFLPGKGVRLNTSGSRVDYTLEQTLTAGEFSMMITGIDEGSPGAKSKVMSMQEGGGDITTNDYRFTIEMRGRDYVPAGAITFRVITGNAANPGSVKDGARYAVPMNDETWYFWKATWGDGFAAVEVRENGPTGPVIYGSSVSTDGHPYRPTPHVIHIGSPLARGGEGDSTVAGMIAKNIWVSANPRPSFPSAR